MGKEEIQFEVFPGRNMLGLRRWNWRIRDLSNGKVLGGSTGQNYSRMIDARRTASKIARYAHIAEVVEVEK